MNLHRLISILLLIFAATLTGGRTSAATPVSDMKCALDFCQQATLQAIEGIWQFTEDKTTVLIRAIDTDPSRFEIVVVESADCRLTPNDVIGYLSATPVPTKFEMNLYRGKKGNILTDLAGCAAELSKDGNALLISEPRVKLSLRYMSFLPKFWRMLRVTLDNPAANLPRGLVRLYPTQNSDHIYYY